MRIYTAFPDEIIDHLIQVDEICTIKDLCIYQHQRFGPDFTHIPGIVVAPFTFSLIDCLFERIWEIDSDAMRDLIVIPIDEGYFVTTHIESCSAGQQAYSIIASVVSNQLEREFACQLRRAIKEQHKNHQQWKGTGKRVFRIFKTEDTSLAGLN